MTRRQLPTATALNGPQRFAGSRVRALRVESLETRRVLAQVVGAVFHDLNGNASRDFGEVALADRVVFLDVDRNGSLDVGDPISPTDSAGRFAFDGLLPGRYSIGLFAGSTSQQLTLPSQGLLQVIINDIDQTATAAIGVQVWGDNVPPPVDTLIGQGLEDDVWSASLDRFGVSDPDGDQLALLLTTPPRHGQLVNWSPTAGWTYRPEKDFAGTDSFEVAISDGRSLVRGVTIQVAVQPVNDPPRGMTVTLEPFGEFAAEGTAVGWVTVDDPDAGADYQLRLSDPRLQSKGLQILVAAGAVFDFELQPFIGFVIDAIDRSPDGANDSISDSKTVKVLDQNDPVTGVILHGKTVLENQPGAEVGELDILDQDGTGDYRVIFDDDRFVYVDGTVKLRDDKSLDYEAQKSIDLGVVVTELDAAGRWYRGSIKIDVQDVNERPFDLVGGFHPIAERMLGADAGAVLVLDQDARESHALTVDDPRFTIVDGYLKLRDDVAVSQKLETHILVRITATDKGGLQLSEEFTLEVGENAYPWHNLDLNADVDGDGRVNPRDVIIIINELNGSGGGDLGDPYPLVNSIGNHRFMDVNSDGMLTALDALIIINYLNREAQGEGEAPLGGRLHSALAAEPVSRPSSSNRSEPTIQQRSERASNRPDPAADARQVWSLAFAEYLRESVERRGFGVRPGRASS